VPALVLRRLDGCVLATEARPVNGKMPTKKPATMFALNVLATSLLAQGTVNFLNSPATLIRTNALASGGTIGPTATNLGGFYYGVFTAPSTVTSLSPSDLLTPTWTFTGLYGSNRPTSTGGRLVGGGFGVTVPTGWAEFETRSFVVAGWSANVALPDWTAVQVQLTGTSFNNGIWSGPNWSPSSAGGFFGVSAVGVGTAYPGVGYFDLPIFTLFGTTQVLEGTPIPGFDLFVVNAPEPSTWTLAAFGIVALLASRACRLRK